MRCLRAAIVSAALMIASAASGECRPGKLELPVTMEGLRPLVPVTIDGKPARTMVDTGAFWSMITPAAAARLELKRTSSLPEGLVIYGVKGSAEAAVVKVGSLGLGKGQVHNIDFLLAGGEIGAESIGVLGRNLLRSFDLEIDLANGQMRFWQFKGCGGKALVYWAKADTVYNVIPIERTEERTGPVIATVLVNGVKVRAEYDTGASTSILSLAAARRAGIRTDSPGVVERGFSSGIGRKMFRTWTAPIQSFEIGGEKALHTKITIGDIDNSTDMLIGDDFFLSNRVLIAFSQDKIYFTYNGGKLFNIDPDSQGASTAAINAKAIAVLSADPTDADGFARRGNALLARGEVDRAIADLTKAIDLAPNKPKYLSDRAAARERKGQPFLAMADLDAAVKLKPDDSETLLRRAQFRIVGRDLDGARADLDGAAAAAPEQADLRLRIGELYEAAEQHAAAIRQYTLWITWHRADSGYPMALNNRCWARTLANTELDAALADCDAAVRATGKSAQTLDSRGLTHLRRGEYARAIADYDAALVKRPDMGWSLYGRGLAKIKLGDKPGGDADLAAAAKVAPKLAERAKGYGIAP